MTIGRELDGSRDNRVRCAVVRNPCPCRACCRAHTGIRLDEAGPHQNWHSHCKRYFWRTEEESQYCESIDYSAKNTFSG